MRSPLPVLAVLVLALAGCGADEEPSPRLIPAATADDLVTRAERIREQADDGECSQARGTAERLRRDVRQLERVDAALQKNLEAWADYLVVRARADCEEPVEETPTVTVPTQTQTTETQTTETTPPTETAPPTETTPPPTETAPPTETVPPGDTTPEDPGGTPPGEAESGAVAVTPQP